jgi:ABC-type oligopeptide transport system substrate-binding subunit
MRKTSLITAILLLSAVWAVAQTSPSSSPQSTTPDASSQTSPSSTSPSQQPATPGTATTTQTTTTQTTQTSSDSANSIEGCLNGSAGNWTLTDQSGKTYQLAGDTSKLSDHVGHQVRITGTDNSSSASSSGSSPSSSATGAGSSSGSQPTFTVQKVKMISSTCSTTSK